MMTGLAAACAFAASAGQAATRVDAQAFSMEYTAGVAVAELHLLSEEAGAVRLSLDSLGNDLSGWSASGTMDAYDADGQLVRNAAATWGEYTIRVASGYRVTGFLWTGIVNGGLEAAWHEGQEGIAASNLWLNWATRTNGAPTLVGEIAFDDQAGASMLAFGTASGLAYEGDFTLSFDGGAAAQAQGIVYTLPDGTPVGVPSIASIGLHDMALTVYVSPVPEPQAWLLLLGGAGALAGWRRLRRR